MRVFQQPAKLHGGAETPEPLLLKFAGHLKY